MIIAEVENQRLTGRYEVNPSDPRPYRIYEIFYSMDKLKQQLKYEKSNRIHK